MEQPEKTAVVYSSTSRAETSLGAEVIQQQTSECARVARELGIRVVAGFVDFGAEGTIASRPNLAKVFEWLDHPTTADPDYLAVASVDRLTHDPDELLQIYQRLHSRGLDVLIAEDEVILELESAEPTTSRYRPDTMARIKEHGPAFAACLLLPDVNEDDAPEVFRNSYAHSYKTIGELIDATLEAFDLRSPFDDVGIATGVNVNANAILRLVFETFDAVRYDGQLHCFWK